MRLIGNPNQLPSGATIQAAPFTQVRQCAVTGRTEDAQGFLDTGFINPETDKPVVISVGAVKEMGRIVGMASQEDVEALVREFEVRFAAQETEIAKTRDTADQALELEKARLVVAQADDKE